MKADQTQTPETREAIAKQPFERHPALASWIERLANTNCLPLGDWMVFLGALNLALSAPSPVVEGQEDQGSSVAESGGTALPKSEGLGPLDWETAPLGATLWGVYGPECFPTIFACQMKDSPFSGRCLWGFSIYRRIPDFRTLGVGKAWGEAKELRLYATRAEAFDDVAQLFSRAI